MKNLPLKVLQKFLSKVYLNVLRNPEYKNLARVLVPDSFLKTWQPAATLQLC